MIRRLSFPAMLRAITRSLAEYGLRAPPPFGTGDVELLCIGFGCHSPGDYVTVLKALASLTGDTRLKQAHRRFQAAVARDQRPYQPAQPSPAEPRWRVTQGAHLAFIKQMAPVINQQIALYQAWSHASTSAVDDAIELLTDKREQLDEITAAINHLSDRVGAIRDIGDARVLQLTSTTGVEPIIEQLQRVSLDETLTQTSFSIGWVLAAGYEQASPLRAIRAFVGIPDETP